MNEKNSLNSDETGLEFQAKFDPREYIQKYYSPVEDPEGMAQIALTMNQDSDGNYIIDEISQSSKVSHEIIENVAIFDFFRVVTEHFLEEFPNGNAGILDIGGGPTIYQHIGLSLIADSTIHSDYLEANRDEITLWLSSNNDSYNWDSYFALAQHLDAPDVRTHPVWRRHGSFG